MDLYHGGIETLQWSSFLHWTSPAGRETKTPLFIFHRGCLGGPCVGSKRPQIFYKFPQNKKLWNFQPPPKKIYPMQSWRCQIHPSIWSCCVLSAEVSVFSEDNSVSTVRKINKEEIILFLSLSMFFPSGRGSVTLPSKRTPQEILKTFKIHQVWRRFSPEVEGEITLEGSLPHCRKKGTAAVFNLRLRTVGHEGPWGDSRLFTRWWKKFWDNEHFQLLNTEIIQKMV